MIAIIVFVIIMLCGVFETVSTTPRLSGEKEHIDDETTKDLLTVGIISIIGGLMWPLLIPVAIVASIIVILYKLMRRFRGKK